jgi:hypothetical protein
MERRVAFTVQNSRWGTREQLVAGAVEVQVADAFLALRTVSVQGSA